MVVAGVGGIQHKVQNVGEMVIKPYTKDGSAAASIDMPMDGPKLLHLITIEREQI